MFEEKTMLTRLFALIAQLWHLLTHPEYARYLQFNSAGDAFILMNANEVRLSLLTDHLVPVHRAPRLI
jgi:hypothetical protein